MTNICSISLKGVRPSNEDRLSILLNSDKKDKKFKDIDLFAIFDGHGSRIISKFLYDYLPIFFMSPKVKYPLTKKYINAVYTKIQEKIIEKCDKYAKISGSTSLVVAKYHDGISTYIDIVNLGDCRCVLCRDNLAVQLSKDHKPSWPDEKARIEKLGGIIKFDAGDWRIGDLSVSRSFGDLDNLPYVTHIPEIFKYRISKEDKFMILACDGLWDVVSNNDAVNIVLSTCYKPDGKRKETYPNIAKKLAEFALENHSTDNLSIIVIFF